MLTAEIENVKKKVKQGQPLLPRDLDCLLQLGGPEIFGEEVSLERGGRIVKERHINPYHWGEREILDTLRKHKRL